LSLKGIKIINAGIADRGSRIIQKTKRGLPLDKFMRIKRDSFRGSICL